MTEPHICVIGAAHWDQVGRFDAPSISGASNPGRMAPSLGGAALNVACNLHCLGVDVFLTSVVGADRAGDTVKDALRAREIAFKLQTARDHRTASYTAFTEPDGDLRVALSDMGVYEAFEASAIARPTKEPSWLVVDCNLPEPAICTLLEHPFQWKIGLTVSPAKAPRLASLTSELDLLLTNKSEALSLCSQKDNGQTAQDCAAHLKRAGLRRAVISNGSNSLAILDEGAIIRVAVPALSDELKARGDVIGAGDALAAGIIYGLATGKSLVDAAAQGLQTARAIIEVEGPYRADLSKAAGISPQPQEK